MSLKIDYYLKVKRLYTFNKFSILLLSIVNFYASAKLLVDVSPNLSDHSLSEESKWYCKEVEAIWRTWVANIFFSGF